MESELWDNLKNLSLGLLQQRERDLKKELLKIQTTIHSLQEVCFHDMRYEGHDHKYDFYKCTICNKEEIR